MYWHYGTNLEVLNGVSQTRRPTHLGYESSVSFRFVTVNAQILVFSLRRIETLIRTRDLRDTLPSINNASKSRCDEQSRLDKRPSLAHMTAICPAAPYCSTCVHGYTDTAVSTYSFSLQSSLRSLASTDLHLSQCKKKKKKSNNPCLKSFRQCDICTCSRWCDVTRM